MIISHRCLSQFTQGSAVLPRADYSFAVGYDSSTDTILLVGGEELNKESFVTFHDDNFNDHGTDYLTQEQATHGESQHYTQLDDELWIIQDDGEGFITMNTTTYAVDIPSITIPVTVGDGACLSAVPGYLIVVGGWTNTSAALRDTQIYSLSDKQWLSSVPLLPTVRTFVSCVVVDNTLYVIGGIQYLDGSFSSLYNDIQYLDLENIDQISTKTCHALSSKLRTGRCATRAVVHGTDIYVIGGYDGGRNYDVQIIDSLTGICNTASDYLPYGTSFAPSIIVNDILYVFGGSTGLVGIDKYVHKSLATLNADPTATPTRSSSSDPTSAPTNDPTISPTKFPTRNTIIVPTKNPSETPLNTVVTNYTVSIEISNVFGESDDEDVTTPWILSTAVLGAITVLYCLYRCYKDHHSKDMVQDNQGDDDVDNEQGMVDVNVMNIMMDLHDVDDVQEVPVIHVAASEGPKYVPGVAVYDKQETKEESIMMDLHDVDDAPEVPVIHIATSEGPKYVAEVAVYDKQETKEESIVDVAVIEGNTVEKEEDDNDCEDKDVPNGICMVRDWLKNVVGLEQYYDIFMSVGFETLDIIKEIESIEELESIGIMQRDHQRKLLEETKYLREQPLSLSQ